MKPPRNHLRQFNADRPAPRTVPEAEVEAMLALRKKIATRLRAVRVASGHSLQDVEAMTNGQFNASVLGAYERGERDLTVHRLVSLARFYRVDVSEFLNDNEAAFRYETVDGPDRSPQWRRRVGEWETIPPRGTTGWAFGVELDADVQ